MSSFYGGSTGQPIADRRFEYALQLFERGDFEAAADLYRQAISIAPSWPPLHFYLGDTLARLGLNEAASGAYQNYLTLAPKDHMGARIKLALLAQQTPECLPEEYIKSLFDQYAPRFEHSLVETLDYRIPEKLAQAVGRVKDATFERVLDLGCGTGLAGEAFKHKARWLEGVDLSSEMVALATQKNVYNSLHVQSIEGFIERSHAPYDLILAADVFVYVGALEAIFRHCAGHLNPGGLMAFSVQSAPAPSYILGYDHRYAHSDSYIRDCADQAGMNVAFTRETDIRQDAGKAIPGMIFILQTL